MKVYYSEAHREHNPPFEVFEGGIQVPVFECPERMDRILGALRHSGWADIMPPEDVGLDPILAVHNADYIEYLRTAFDDWQRDGGELGARYASPVLIPAAFPPRRSAGKPRSIGARAGYYTMDLSAPIVAGTYRAAVESAQCAVSAAKAVAAGERVAYALCRPPGHHAGRDYCGGYCYLNNASIAARWLSLIGKVAVLDIDYHAGNGTQDIFYESADVLTISIHANPATHYPSFMGYADEIGEGIGRGRHRNFPLPSHTGDADYLRAFGEALELIRNFSPRALVVSAGMDIHVGDPLGDFDVTTEGIGEIGRRIVALGLPTVVAQEGGYNTDALGANVVSFLSAFA
ncbi:MAG: histone deacetylase family protein [Chloroflexi bacterium]|nr:histone deacetylase family protein [Chloroflexota bacterium]